ncbi:acyltransferase, partial [Marivirga lumbricoides]
YFAPANHEQPLLHTWSLAVEIQFYLLAPFAVLVFPLRSLKWFFAMALVGLTAVAEYRLRYVGIEQATYYSLYARLPEFFAGSLAALYMRHNQHRISGSEWVACVGLVLISLSAIAQPLLGPFPGVAALMPVAGSVLLLTQPATKGMICRLLNSSVLVWVGAISYSLYIWHWPVLAFLRYYTGAEVLNFGFSLLFIGVTLALSVASYYLIEQGFRAKRAIKKQVLLWGVLVSGVLGTSQVMAKVNEIFTPELLPIEYRRYADPATICHGKVVGECLRGDLSSEHEILVLGDSHAA